ncbi:MAG: aldo/keto reductase [Ignavibacteria bacterium]|nr:aldo/keto reductase [Ignavibacteria bacterium]
MSASFGFGCYRVSDTNPKHEEALRFAVASGISLIDTSSNYGNGASERLVGKLDKRPLTITKLGYAQGEILDMMNARQAISDAYADVVKVGEGISHCIHPDFLSDAFERSLARLGSDSVDVLLLHNPEYYLQIAHQSGLAVNEARNEFYNRIYNAFKWLEQQCSIGRIHAYGISSNTFVNQADAPDFVSLEKCIAIAHSVGGSANAFKYAQMPLNIIEHYAATTLNQAFDEEHGYAMTTLELAKENDVLVLINRPLNAIVDSDIIRLASHEIYPHAPQTATLESRVHSLEVVEHDVLQMLIAAGNQMHRSELSETFRVAGSLCQSWNKFDGLMHWRDVRKSFLDPRLAQAERFRSSEDERLGMYLDDVRNLLDDIENIYAVEENNSLEELRLTAAELFGLPSFTPLQHIALHALRCTDGVSAVLVGMRTPEYVRDVLSVYHLPEATFTREKWNQVEDHLVRLSS